MIGETTIPLFVALPLAGAFLTALLKRIKGIPDVLGSLASAATLAMSLITILKLEMGQRLVFNVGNWGAVQDQGLLGRIVGIQLVIDGFTALMLVVVNLVAFLVAVYSVNYMTRYTSKWKFYSLFLLMLAGMNGVIITGDMFNLFVFVEIASLASYALVAFGTGKRELEASFKYAIMGGIGSLLILLGVIFLYSTTGTLNMGDMARVLATMETPSILYLVFGLFVAGFGLKAAIVPFHAWLPDAHPSAPAPISAMLSGVLIKALGVYVIARVFFSLFSMPQELSVVLLTLSAISMGVGALVALRQWDMKRLLAYSSISQVGYILLGLGIGTPLGILGAVFHLFNHSVFKSLLFLDSGAVEYATGTRQLKEMGGLSRKMPVTSFSTLAGAMSLAGVPPFAGFWSKLIIIVAAVQASHMKMAVWAVLMSMVTIAYVLKVTRFAFLGSLREKFADIKEVPLLMKFTLAVLALICIFGGLLLLPDLRHEFLAKAANVLSAAGGVQ